MKIKVAKDFEFDQMIYESDIRAYRDKGRFARTFKSDYSSQWKEEDITLEQLESYIKKGYAIKINC